MRKYLKPIITIYEIEPPKLFACSEGCPSEDTIDLGYEESEKFWNSITAD